MKLWIDQQEVTATPGKTLLDMVKALGMDTGRLQTRPLAAAIAGEVFTLNYVPLRVTRDPGGLPERRKAMEASGGSIRLLRYGDKMGKGVYDRTAKFILFLALRQLWPGAVAKINYTVGQSLNVSIHKTPTFCPEDVPALKERFQQLVDQDIPLVRKRIITRQAVETFCLDGQQDKAKLLSWRQEPWYDVYQYGDYMDYFYGEMVPSTGYIRVWDIISDGKEGIQLCYPRGDEPDQVSRYRPMPNFSAVCAESERWCALMDCDTLSDLNQLVADRQLGQLIQVSEALHERSFSQMADQILARGARAVLLAGPSSSGKTTSANRLGVQLRVHGKKPVLMSLDDYYVDRDKIAPGPDGKLDLEHINTIDTGLFRSHLKQLLSGGTVELPHFDFSTGKRIYTGKTFTLAPDAVVIIEGLHALNPTLLPEDTDPGLIYRVYVSALYPLNLDNHNRIATSYLRLLRRIVRDCRTRGTSPSGTLSMWDSVRRGEERWIFPYQEQADVIFNSSLVYELAVLKPHIYPMLTAITPEDPNFEDARALCRILEDVLPCEMDREIPPTSILREFIGGNAFFESSVVGGGTVVGGEASQNARPGNL